MGSLQILFSTVGFITDLHHLLRQKWKLSHKQEMQTLPLTSALLTIAQAVGVIVSSKTKSTSTTEKTTPVNPPVLKQAMDQASEKFIGYEQRDAHEFISDLIDMIHEELTSAH